MSSSVRAARRIAVERAWVAAVLLWSICRIALVWSLLADYGVNPYVYAAVDLGSSLPYGVASARLVQSIVDRRHRAAWGWGGVALASFLAPDIYIVASGRSMPWVVYGVVLVVAAACGAAAVREGRRRVVVAEGEEKTSTP